MRSSARIPAPNKPMFQALSEGMNEARKIRTVPTLLMGHVKQWLAMAAFLASIGHSASLQTERSRYSLTGHSSAKSRLSLSHTAQFLSKKPQLAFRKSSHSDAINVNLQKINLKGQFTLVRSGSRGLTVIKLPRG